jgi:hypothetical protein
VQFRLKDCKYIKFIDIFDAETFSNDVYRLLKLKSSDFGHDLSTKFEPLNKIIKGER